MHKSYDYVFRSETTNNFCDQIKCNGYQSTYRMPRNYMGQRNFSRYAAARETADGYRKSGKTLPCLHRLSKYNILYCVQYKHVTHVYSTVCNQPILYFCIQHEDGALLFYYQAELWNAPRHTLM